MFDSIYKVYSIIFFKLEHFLMSLPYIFFLDPRHC